MKLVVDSKLSFRKHTNNKISKATKSTRLLCKLQPILPRWKLLIIYKSFIRRHLDYDDVIYDLLFTASFTNKIKSVQRNAALATFGTIKGSSPIKFYQELGLEYLQQRRRMRRLCLLYKIFSTGQQSRIHNLLLQMENSHVFPCRTEYFNRALNEWNKVGSNIRSSTEYNIFCNA